MIVKILLTLSRRSGPDDPYQVYGFEATLINVVA